MSCTAFAVVYDAALRLRTEECFNPRSLISFSSLSISLSLFLSFFASTRDAGSDCWRLCEFMCVCVCKRVIRLQSEDQATRHLIRTTAALTPTLAISASASAVCFRSASAAREASQRGGEGCSFPFILHLEAPSVTCRAISLKITLSNTHTLANHTHVTRSSLSFLLLRR